MKKFCSRFGDANETWSKMVFYILAGIVNYVVLSPILLTFVAVVFSVSSVGKAFGLRRLYVNFLLRIFEVSERASE